MIKSFAYDNPIQNNLVINKFYKGSNVNKEYDRFELQQDKTAVVLLFPKKAEKESSTANDVKQILLDILREQLPFQRKEKTNNERNKKTR